ncbi:MAG TPA: hypothetical protein DEP84_24630 [Chloroflexi bacterium]|nr:hypothetical protein [Chloroflexota bacterium]
MGVVDQPECFDGIEPGSIGREAEQPNRQLQACAAGRGVAGELAPGKALRRRGRHDVGMEEYRPVGQHHREVGGI